MTSHNKNVTRLTIQGYDNIVISDLLEQPISIRLLQLLTTCSKHVDILGQAVRTQLVGKLATRCEILACVALNAKIILFQIQRIPGAVSSVRLQ
jgi:hypothetical protein